jgi:predicted outer membrane protein
MKHSTTLKMSLMGALLAFGVLAADDSRTKDMNKGKADASFVEQAAVASQTEIKLSELAVSQSTNASVKELAQKLIDDHTKVFDSLREISTNKGIILPFQSVGSRTTTGSVGDPGTAGIITGSGNTGSGNTGSGSADMARPYASDPAASGERMGAGDRMNTEAHNAMGQLSTPAQKKYDDLAKLTGDKFDRQYLGNIIDSHKKSIRFFEKESKSGDDAELKSWATNTLTNLKMHLDMAQTTEREVKNNRTPSM